MEKVIILTTGGTIASMESQTKGIYTSGAMTGEALVDKEKLDREVQVKVESVFQTPSNAMTFDNLMGLRERILDHFNDPAVSGIVITHGTDTLEESSYFLDLVVDDPRPVVMTGSQRVPCEEGTDAFTNIRDAVTAAASARCREMGVLVMFNEHLFAARYVKKNHAFNVNAFTSFKTGAAGYVDKGQVYIMNRPSTRESHIPQGAIPRVEIIKAGLDSGGDLIDAAVANGIKGIVLEGSGRGHVSPEMALAAGRAVEKNVPVVITTACEQGRVHPVYDFRGGVMDLTTKGVIPGHDYDSKKARIKLVVLLASGIDSSAALQKAFSE